VRIQFVAVLGLSLGVIVGCAGGAASPSPGLLDAASQGAQAYTFRLVIGGDTVASDVVQRAPTEVQVGLINRIQAVRSELTMTVAADESVTGATLRNFPLGSTDTVPITTLVVELVGDSVWGELTRAGRGTQRSVFPTRPGAVVYLETASATVEQVMRRARALGGETATVPVFDLLSAQSAPAVVRWVGADSAVAAYGGLEVHVRTAADGSLLEYTVPALGAHATRLEGAQPLGGD
jgi:hypothetical protein